MKFLLQVYFNSAQQPLERLTEDERQAIVDEYTAFFRSPGIIDGHQLQPPTTATTVRSEDGQPTRSAGPVHSGAPLGGYYLVDVDDLDAALTLAARVPAVRMGGAVEVRPVVTR